MAERPTKDELLLETETPQDQVDRMGNGWKLQAQYEKQLELPVHMQAEGPPTFGGIPARSVYSTVCGLVIGDVMLRATDDPEDVTCLACAEG